jgi:nucleoside-diphosphate kinase
MDQNNMEQTLVLIKPDALLNSLTGYMLSTLSEFHTGLRFAAAKIVCVHKALAEEHYAEHQGKPFYEPLLEYIMGLAHYPDAPEKRRVIALILRGPGAIAKIRRIAGPTNPHVAREDQPGTIRALGTVVPIKDDDGNVVNQRIDNLIHASASVEEGEREIKLWFRPNDIPPGMRAYPTEVSDAFYYLRDGKLLATYEPGCTCLLTPGDTAWSSDLETLRLLSSGATAENPLGTVAAKYLLNEHLES